MASSARTSIKLGFMPARIAGQQLDFFGKARGDSSDARPNFERWPIDG
jgi:hypothetical protein